jgi:hypothetical protein
MLPMHVVTYQRYVNNGMITFAFSIKTENVLQMCNDSFCLAKGFFWKLPISIPRSIGLFNETYVRREDKIFDNKLSIINIMKLLGSLRIQGV